MASNTKQPTPAGNGKHIGRPSEQDPGYSARSKQMSQVRQELFRHEIKVSKACTILRADPNWVQRCRLRLQKRPDLPRRIVDFMAHKDVTNGAEGSYHLIDWGSWKLPRAASSSLAAESQAASKTGDSLLCAAAFWKLIWSPYLALQDNNMAKLQHTPKMVINATAIYDLLVK